MTESGPNDIPDRIRQRVQSDPESYISRDLSLARKYRFGDEIKNEPVKGIQKEIDGMARLLCAIAEEGERFNNVDQYIRIYQAEIEKLRCLEDQVISELPEREE